MLSPIITQDIKKIVSETGKVLNKLEGETILITGASGFFGSYFLDTIDYLNKNKFKKPCKVIALQRGDPKKVLRTKHLVSNKHIKFVKHDVRFPYKPKVKVSYIVCSAGMSAPALFQSDPLGTIDANVNGVRWALEYAKKDGVKSILYMSSGETYGSPTPKNIPTPETYSGNVSPLNTRACYAESKRLAETLCVIYFEKFGVPVKIARPFVIYGPGITLGDRRVLGDFMRAGVSGKPIQMLSEGLDTRSYTYISDAMVAFLKILLSKENGEAFNVASGLEEVRILDIAKTVHKICGIKKPVSVKTKKKAAFIKDAPARVKPDITKLKKTFNFNPKIMIDEGIARTINWNKEVLKGKK